MANRVDNELETLIRARYPIVYVVSWEEKRVEDALRVISRERGKKLHVWTVTQGFSTTGGQRDNVNRDPLAALDYVINSPDQAIFLLKDFHSFISDYNVTRRLRDLTPALKNSFKNLLILSPILKLPAELEKEITVLDYGLPSYEDLGRLLDDIIRDVRDKPGVDSDLTSLERESVLKAAQGLTQMEAENVFAKSLVEKRTFDIDVILSEKEQIIRKSGILEYFPMSEAFSSVGGLDLLKTWMEKRTTSFTDKARDFGLPEPKGILLLGVQGCGKSLSAKAIGAQWRLPLLRLDVGKVFAGLVGASEENMRKAIRVAESVAPCVAGDTRITLADGSERTIQLLYEGTEQELSVLSMTEDWKIEPTRVKAITRRVAPDLFSVQLKHGQLQATSNHLHPVLRNGVLEWVRTDALQKGDHVAVPGEILTSNTAPRMISFLPSTTRLYADNALSFAHGAIQTPQRRYAARKRAADFVKVSELQEQGRYPRWDTITKFAIGRGGTTDSNLEHMPEEVGTELGYLLGLIASDGFLSRRCQIGFVNTEMALHHRFSDLLCRLFGVSSQTRLNDAQGKNTRLVGTSAESVFRPCYVTYANNTLLNRTLACVQAHLLQMPTSVLKAWLRGYFDGDGYIADGEAAAPKVVLTSKRKAQNQLIRSIMQRVGFPTTNPNSVNIEITGIYNVRRFIQQIGSEHPCKQARMEAWMQNPITEQPKDRNDVLPVGELLRTARRAVGMGSHQFRSASSGLMNRYERGQGHPNRDRLRALVTEMQGWAADRGGNTEPLEALQNLAESPIAWSPVLSVKREAAPEFVYDLVCEGPHNFLANGIVTHNCILWLDELEKGLSGMSSSGSTDGGTTSRVFSTFLTWLQEKTVPVFVVATANQVEALPPELLRKGRFDEIFFIDLPSKSERADIFKIHIKKRKRDPAKYDLERLATATPGFSGAEIEQAVVEALYDAFDADRDITTEDILKAARASVPLSMTMREKIAYLRDWASTRCREASSAPPESIEEQTAAFLKARAEEEAARRKEAPKLEAPNGATEGTAGSRKRAGSRKAAAESGE